MRRGSLLVVGAACLGALLALSAASATGTHALLRVDQVGYLPSDPKIAYLMTSAAVSGETYKVVDGSGSTVASGQVTGSSRGSWNSAYSDVYPIDFAIVSTPGSYRVVVDGPVSASSDPFRVESVSALYGPLVADGVSFFRNRRDGSNVIPGPFNRRPSHLNDRSASVYATPKFQSPTSDVIVGDLKKIGGPVDVQGGWFDAGDYLKFTFTAAYADSLLYLAGRALGSQAPPSLLAEAHYGTTWLNKMWVPSKKLLYLQVGIGSGNGKTFFGDHDLWRLPQADDSDTRRMDYYAARHRPVFEAGAPGARIDPDIVGRVAAAFALAAQADAVQNSSRARTELQAATSLYALANPHPSRQLGSTVPTSYYQESIWHDAMEFAGTEIALAHQDLGDPTSGYMPYLRQAAVWAKDYISADSGKDTLNLYDVSALAHADLITAIARAGSPGGLAVTPAQLIADLKAQVGSVATRASSDIFHAGGDYTNFDVDSHTFGFISTEALYRRATGEGQYSAFAAEQRDWVLGANPWGMSFMVGLGTRFPHCMQSQIPNLAGSLNGQPPIDTGAVVNGPNNQSNFSGGLGGLQAGMRKCENDGGVAFTGHQSEYVDDVRAWQTDEPALDMTASAILAGALVSGGS
jgi:hypothetical protein